MTHADTQCDMRQLRRFIRRLSVPEPEVVAIIGAVVLAALAVLASFVDWLSHP